MPLGEPVTGPGGVRISPVVMGADSAGAWSAHAPVALPASGSRGWDKQRKRASRFCLQTLLYRKPECLSYLVSPSFLISVLSLSQFDELRLTI